MIDISSKFDTLRIAKAEGLLECAPQVIDAIQQGRIPKGNPFEVAKVAAVQAAKDTSRIIPYCHNLPILGCSVCWAVVEKGLKVQVEVKTLYKTGVEVEAMTAAAIALLTVYDMCKFMDESMVMRQVELLSKSGGKSDSKQDILEASQLKCGVLVLSDTVAAGRKSDRSGICISEKLQSLGIQAPLYRILPDEKPLIAETLRVWADQEQLDLILTSGGTGFSPRDTTPEAMEEVIERDVPGINEWLRSFGQQRTPMSMLSRGRGGIRGQTLIINLPGSTRGVKESLDALFPGILHAFSALRGGPHGDGSGYGPANSPLKVPDFNLEC
jgi:cyclic pyranopterin phosphate synthase